MTRTLLLLIVYSQVSDTLVYGKEAANTINEYFCDISVTLSADLPTPLRLPDVQIPHSIPTYIDRAPLRDNEVIKEIQKIDISKASGF